MVHGDPLFPPAAAVPTAATNPDGGDSRGGGGDCEVSSEPATNPAAGRGKPSLVRARALIPVVRRHVPGYMLTSACRLSIALHDHV